ncbi:MAG: PadR family transcriptional regulator [Mycobacteriales bacterium]
MLEFAILGLLADAPRHGYELRKRLGELLGGLRVFSFGSLYPTLRRLEAKGLITPAAPVDGVDAPALSGRRARIVYQLTPEGKERFGELLADVSPSAYDDEQFGVHLAFFSQTSAPDRLRILQGRRRRVEERREGMSNAFHRTAERFDHYTRQLHEHGLDAADREVRWLSELIDNETRAHEQSTHPQTSGSPSSSRPHDGSPKTPTTRPTTPEK